MARLNLLEKVVKEFGVDNEYISLDPVMEFTAESYKAMNDEIRNAAFFAIMAVYERIGERVKGYLMTVKKSLRELLKTGFNEIDAGGNFDDRHITGLPEDPLES